MAFVKQGFPLGATTVTFMDEVAKWLRCLRVQHGSGQDTEATVGINSLGSIAYTAKTGLANIVGDGSTIYGIDNAELQKVLTEPWKQGIINSRFEVYGGLLFRPIIAAYESFIQQALPKYNDFDGSLKQWNFSNEGLHVLDAYLLKMNGTHASCPLQPTGTPTLTAIVGGAIPTCTAGNAPFVTYAFVGPQDYYESRRSADAVQVALSGDKSGYYLNAIQTPIPAGVTKIRIYRTAVASTNRIYVKDYPCTAGAAAPTNIPLLESDLDLNINIGPTAFGLVMAMTEFAIAFSIAYGSIDTRSLSSLNLPIVVSSNGMLNPANVTMPFSNGVLGLGNVASGAIFRKWAATVQTAGTLNTANDINNLLQGFAGSIVKNSKGIRARTTATLNSNATLTNIDITYTEAGAPTTPVAATLAGPFVLGSALDSTIAIDATDAFLIKSVTDFDVSGATTGEFIIEANPSRTV